MVSDLLGTVTTFLLPPSPFWNGALLGLSTIVVWKQRICFPQGEENILGTRRQTHRDTARWGQRWRGLLPATESPEPWGGGTDPPLHPQEGATPADATRAARGYVSVVLNRAVCGSLSAKPLETDARHGAVCAGQLFTVQELPFARAVTWGSRWEGPRWTLALLRLSPGCTLKCHFQEHVENLSFLTEPTCQHHFIHGCVPPFPSKPRPPSKTTDFRRHLKLKQMSLYLKHFTLGLPSLQTSV